MSFIHGEVSQAICNFIVAPIHPLDWITPDLGGGPPTNDMLYNVVKDPGELIAETGLGISQSAKLDKPDVDRIDGLSPAVAIEQRSASGGPRSTVGTRTEILDHLRMLYARIGQTRSPVSGEVVRKDSVTDVVQHILQAPTSRLLIVAPMSGHYATLLHALDKL